MINNPPIESAKDAIPTDSGLSSRATRYILNAVATLLMAAWPVAQAEPVATVSVSVPAGATGGVSVSVAH